MDNLIKKSAKIKFFKSMLIKLFSLLERSLFSIHDPIGAKLLTTLQLKFSHLYKNKFCHISRILSVLYMTGTEPKTTEHFFLALPHFGNWKTKTPYQCLWQTLLIANSNEESMTDILLYGYDRFNERDNKEVLPHVIDYIKSTKRFERALIDQYLL